DRRPAYRLDEPCPSKATPRDNRRSLCLTPVRELTMSGRRAFAVLALLLLPSIASAQRTKSGAASGRDKNLMTDDGSKDRRAEITTRELEEQSPLRLLVDKRKDLKLSDDQLTKLKDLESKLKEKNGSLLRIVDSVNREMRP